MVPLVNTVDPDQLVSLLSIRSANIWNICIVNTEIFARVYFPDLKFREIKPSRNGEITNVLVAIFVKSLVCFYRENF